MDIQIFEEYEPPPRTVGFSEAELAYYLGVNPEDGLLASRVVQVKDVPAKMLPEKK